MLTTIALTGELPASWPGESLRRRPKARTTTGGRALVLVLAALCLGCDTGARSVLSLADYVDHQAANVDTDLIHPGGAGLERLGSGWRVRPTDAGSAKRLEISAPLAALSVFSLAGDLEAIEVEATLVPAAGGQEPHRLDLRLNNRWLKTAQTLREGRHRYRFELPSHWVVEGENYLQMRLSPKSARATRRRDSSLRIHELAAVSGSGRAPRRQRPGEILVRDVDRSQIIEMPSNSRLDLVASLPDRARVTGHLSLSFDGPRREPMTVRFELLDESDEVHLLYDQTVDEPINDRLRVDLAPWAGRLVRLRVRFSGSANAQLSVFDVRIEGRGEDFVPPQQPVGLSATEPQQRFARSDVVILLVDAARADAFSPFGAPHATPAAERLAAGGTLFTRARSPSSWTGQSIPTILTGIYPDTLGMEHWESVLPARVPTLAERFRDAGYRTVLWTQHPIYRRQTELQRGFEEVYHGRSTAPFDLPTPEQMWGSTTEPLFAFVHLMPPHTPYDPPPPFRGSLTSWYTGEERATDANLSSFPMRRRPEELDDDDRRYLRARYQEHVLFADSMMGQVLDQLESAGRYDDTVVVMTSDHGEAFLEHGYFLHSRHLYSEFVDVPLIVKWPAATDDFVSVVEQPVSLVDIAPSLVDGFGLSTDLGFQGASLLPTVFDSQPLARPVYAYTRGAPGARPARPEHLLETHGWKLVANWKGRSYRLFREADDPTEQTDLAEQHPLEVLLLRQQVLMQAARNHRILEVLGGGRSRALDQETIDRLRALGYL